VIVVSEQFEGLNRIARHRLVYNALGPFMASDVHALSINAFTPSER
jgi:BolA protein